MAAFQTKRIAPDTKRALTLIARTAREVFHHAHCTVWLVDRPRRQLQAAASSGRQGTLQRIPIGASEPEVASWVAEHEKPICLPDVSAEKDNIPGPDPTCHRMAVPVWIGKTLVGVLDVASEKTDAFSASDLRLLKLLATQAAVAIRSERQHAREEAQGARLKLRHEISRKMLASLDSDEWLPLVARSICQGFSGSHVMILLKRNPRELVLAAQAGAAVLLLADGCQIQSGCGVVVQVAKTRRAILANDLSEGSVKGLAFPRVGAALGVPILRGKRLAGVIYLESDRPHVFDRTGEELLRKVADEIAGVLVHSKIHTECKQAKDQLQKLIESSSDAITMADKRGRLIFWSKGAEEIFGYKAKEVLGRSASGFYAKGRSKARQIMGELLRKGKLKNVEVEYVGKHRRKIYASLSASLLRDEQGAMIGSLGIIRDISEYRLLSRQLLQAERLATIGRLSTQIGHEIMNPLSSIKMNIAILSKRSDLSRNDQRRLEIANFEIDHMEEILQGIFDYSKDFQLTLSRHSLHKVLDHALLAVQDRLRKKQIQVRKDYAQQLPAVSLDVVRMKQVFVNICLNAVQAMDLKGKLTLRTSRELVGGTPHLLTRISDNGSGIPPEVLDTVFDPFFTTRSDGTGLGLAIVKKIVEQHEGRVEVESVHGRHTRFKVFLPVS